MSRLAKFWYSIWGLILTVLLAITCIGGIFWGIWGIWQWEKSNYREYCEARGLTYREAGERLWCE